MALLNGKATFIHFKAVKPENVLPGINQELTDEFIDERVKAHRFNDIDDTFDDYSIGWVSIADMLDSDFLTMAPALTGKVTMSMRYDERKIPAPILNKCFDKNCKAMMEEKEIPKLSRSMKMEIKARTKTTLSRATVPTPTVIDVYYDVDTMQGVFFSTNKAAFYLFEDLFKTTFGLRVQQEIPYTIGKNIDAQLIDNIFPHFKGDGVAMVDLLEDTKPLGQDFLLWLWWNSEERDILPLSYEDGVAYVTIQNNIVLQSENEKITCAGIQSEHTEAKLGVVEGKKVEQVGFRISYDDMTYSGNINSMFEFRSIAVPELGKAEGEDLDTLGLVLARSQQFTSFTGMIHKLLGRFLEERAAGGWADKVERIYEWADGETV